MSGCFVLFGGWGGGVKKLVSSENPHESFALDQFANDMSKSIPKSEVNQIDHRKT